MGLSLIVRGFVVVIFDNFKHANIWTLFQKTPPRYPVSTIVRGGWGEKEIVAGDLEASPLSQNGPLCCIVFVVSIGRISLLVLDVPFQPPHSESPSSERGTVKERRPVNVKYKNVHSDTEGLVERSTQNNVRRVTNKRGIHIVAPPR
jgi:hypothetical protein